MYKKWLDDIKANSPGRDYDFSKFMSHNESPTEHTHADLASGIGNVLKALNGDVDHFTEKNEFPIDTAHTDLWDNRYAKQPYFVLKRNDIMWCEH